MSLSDLYISKWLNYNLFVASLWIFIVKRRELFSTITYMWCICIGFDRSLTTDVRMLAPPDANKNPFIVNPYTFEIRFAWPRCATIHYNCNEWISPFKTLSLVFTARLLISGVVCFLYRIYLLYRIFFFNYYLTEQLFILQNITSICQLTTLTKGPCCLWGSETLTAWAKIEDFDRVLLIFDFYIHYHGRH